MERAPPFVALPPRLGRGRAETRWAGARATTPHHSSLLLARAASKGKALPPRPQGTATAGTLGQVQHRARARAHGRPARPRCGCCCARPRDEPGGGRRETPVQLAERAEACIPHQGGDARKAANKQGSLSPSVGAASAARAHDLHRSTGGIKTGNASGLAGLWPLQPSARLPQAIPRLEAEVVSDGQSRLAHGAGARPWHSRLPVGVAPGAGNRTGRRATYMRRAGKYFRQSRLPLTARGSCGATCRRQPGSKLTRGAHSSAQGASRAWRHAGPRAPALAGRTHGVEPRLPRGLCARHDRCIRGWGRPHGGQQLQSAEHPPGLPGGAQPSQLRGRRPAHLRRAHGPGEQTAARSRSLGPSAPGLPRPAPAPRGSRPALPPGTGGGRAPRAPWLERRGSCGKRAGGCLPPRPARREGFAAANLNFPR